MSSYIYVNKISLKPLIGTLKTNMVYAVDFHERSADYAGLFWCSCWQKFSAYTSSAFFNFWLTQNKNEGKEQE